MQRRTTLAALAALALSWGAAPALAQNPPKIAVTDLAYAQQVSEYFEAAAYQASAQVSERARSSAYSDSYSGRASMQASGTYVAGRYSYIEQRELAGYTNDIKGAILSGTYLRLVQGKGFDAGAPQPTKAEQVLHQVQTGKMAKPVRQPQVADIIARIKKGEFSGADYVLFGVVSSIQFRDEVSPLQGTSSATYQYALDLLADFSLINTKTYEIKAAFSAQGAGNDTKILSNRGDIVAPNRAKVMRETSRSLAQDVYGQLLGQLGLTAPAMGTQRPVQMMPGQPMPAPQPQQPEQVIILR